MYFAKYLLHVKCKTLIPCNRAQVNKENKNPMSG